jgi:very-short-patch-repair endonuclease
VGPIAGSSDVWFEISQAGRLIVEVDGGSHDDPKQIRRDEFRTARLEQLGYQVLRVPNGMVLKAPDLFAEEIRRFLPSPGPSGHPLPEGEGHPSADSKC